MQKKCVTQLLLDGTADGRIKCTLANWTGVAYRVPRPLLERCDSRREFHQSGVYFLFGVSDQTNKPMVYVGKAAVRQNGKGILQRLKEHLQDAH